VMVEMSTIASKLAIRLLLESLWHHLLVLQMAHSCLCPLHVCTPMYMHVYTLVFSRPHFIADYPKTLTLRPARCESSNTSDTCVLIHLCASI
jgi:hypothetical protein